MNEKLKQNDKEPPFTADSLIESEISNNHKGSGKLNELPENPDKIVRAESFEEIEKRFSGKLNIFELAEITKKLFSELEEKYGISVPATFYIGADKRGNKVIYSVVDKISGKHLGEMENSKEAKKQVSDLYSSVAEYFLDKSKEKGTYLWDTSAPSQYIYGTKPNEQKEKIYLVDTDARISNSPVDMYLAVEWLTRHMSGLEEKFGSKFEEARKYVNQFAAEPLPEKISDSERKKVLKNIDAIKSFLDNKKLGPEPEIATPWYR